LKPPLATEDRFAICPLFLSTWHQIVLGAERSTPLINQNAPTAKPQSRATIFCRNVQIAISYPARPRHACNVSRNVDGGTPHEPQATSAYAEPFSFLSKANERPEPSLIPQQQNESPEALRVANARAFAVRFKRSQNANREWHCRLVWNLGSFVKLCCIPKLELIILSFRAKHCV
jgi:hypothetical protein